MKLRMIVAAVVAALAWTLAIAGSAYAAPTWAPAGSASIHPGAETVTEGAQCTSNFVFFDASNVYIGQAAHCSGTGAATDTNGCEADSLPLGTQVQVEGASRPGTLVYSSWIAMHQANERDSNTCEYNDFALVRLDAADAGKVNPSVPHWGGPTALGSTTSQGEDVYSYGNSSLRFGVGQLKPKKGKSLGSDSGGWNNQVYTVTPGIPGDSGSGFLDSGGRAFGTLSTVAIAPLPASNGVGGLANELSYMRSHSSFSGVTLANGTEPFNGGKLPLGS